MGDFVHIGRTKKLNSTKHNKYNETKRIPSLKYSKQQKKTARSICFLPLVFPVWMADKGIARQLPDISMSWGSLLGHGEYATLLIRPGDGLTRYEYRRPDREPPPPFLVAHSAPPPTLWFIYSEQVPRNQQWTIINRYRLRSVSLLLNHSASSSPSFAYGIYHINYSRRIFFSICNFKGHFFFYSLHLSLFSLTQYLLVLCNFRYKYFVWILSHLHNKTITTNKFNLLIVFKYFTEKTQHNNRNNTGAFPFQNTEIFELKVKNWTKWKLKIEYTSYELHGVPFDVVPAKSFSKLTTNWTCARKTAQSSFPTFEVFNVYVVFFVNGRTWLVGEVCYRKLD